MFGYIVMNKPEIKFKDFDLYRSFYCGLCRDCLLYTSCRTGGHLRAGAAGWQIPEAHKVPFPGVFWRQRDTGTLLGQRKYR